MKKSFIATCALLAAGTVAAQSSVTIFGVLDAAVTHGTGSIADRTQLTHSAYNSSRIGFRGREELGGGMAASFWLEAAVQVDTGAGGATNTNNQASGASTGSGLTFGRRSTVSLSDSWGEIRLGRDYTPQTLNLVYFDPFSNVGVGASLTFTSIITGVTAVRASNSIGYLTPTGLGGFYGQVLHYLGENAGNLPTSDDGNGTGFRAGYANSALDVALSMSRTKYATGDVEQNNIGGRYKFDRATAMGHYSWDRNGVISARGYLLGLVVPVGSGDVRAAYSRYRTDAAGSPAASKLALSYVHHLSKRTALYATAARLKNRGTASFALGGATTAPGGSSTGYDFGMRHSF